MSWTAENLLADTAWMRDLATRLGGDAAVADDLVQDAWMLALRRGERPSRAWLGGVLRKLSFTRRRAEARRAARERHAARPECEPDATHALARVEAQGALVHALLALDEPYRSTLALRYVEGLDTRAIAARCGAPLGTVHSRLSRGHDELRTTLRRRSGERWLAALAPLAHLRRVTAPAFAASTGWGVKAAAGAAAALLLAWVGVKAPWQSSPSPVTTAAPPVVEAGLEERAGATAEPAALAPPSPDAREALAPETTSAPSGPPRWSLGLRVVDVAEEPIEGVHVAAVIFMADQPRSHELGHTDAKGRLEDPFEPLNALGWATCNASGTYLVLSHPSYPVQRHQLEVARAGGPGRLDVTVVLTDEPRLTGRALAADGTPLGGGQVRAKNLAGRQVQYGLTAPDGRFALIPTEGQEGYVIVSTPSNRVSSARVSIGAGDIGDVRMEPLAELGGRVLGRDGRPARGVWVQARARGDATRAKRADGSDQAGHAWAQTATDDDGRFEFDGLRLGTYAIEVEGTLDPPGELVVELPCPDVELRLGGTRLVVRVRDGYGRPEVGVEVIVAPVPDDGVSEPEAEYSWSWPPEGISAFDVVPGASYTLVVPGRGGSPNERIVRIPPDSVEHEVVIVTGAVATDCELLVRARDPDGLAVAVSTVSLEAEHSGAFIEAFDELTPDAEGRLTGLPEGRFQVRVHLAYEESRARGLYLAETTHEVDLSPDRPFELDLRAERGAKLTLEVGAVGWPEGVPEPPAQDAEGYFEHLNAHGIEAVFVTGEPDDLDVDPPRRGSRPLMRPMTHGRVGLVRRWLQGETHTHWRPEAPGRYLLRLSGDGWETFEREIELRAGEETFVRAILVAR